MIRRPPRSTRLSHSFPTRRSSELLAAARRPLVIVGGGGWDAATSDALRRFAEANALPVGASFRCQDYFDNRHPNYAGHVGIGIDPKLAARRSEEHTSELQSLMRISYAVFCLKKKKHAKKR